MALCRVFTNEDGTVRVMHPNPRLQREGEPDAIFVDRICKTDAEKDPSLSGLLYSDVDPATLPARMADDGQGGQISVRDAWRSANTEIAIDQVALSVIISSVTDANAQAETPSPVQVLPKG